MASWLPTRNSKIQIPDRVLLSITSIPLRSIKNGGALYHIDALHLQRRAACHEHVCKGYAITPNGMHDVPFGQSWQCCHVRSAAAYGRIVGVLRAAGARTTDGLGKKYAAGFRVSSWALLGCRRYPGPTRWRRDSSGDAYDSISAYDGFPQMGHAFAPNPR